GLALSVYRKLLALYPERGFYQDKVDELGRNPKDAILGRWKMVSKLGWLEFSAFPDGRLEGKTGSFLLPIVVKAEGHWVFTGNKERTFQLHWKAGNLHDVTVNEDLKTLKGQGLTEGPVSGTRLPGE
ncbi:MAG: hypothetical protein KC910_11455, partial [Candidatus Eremiobacteraeota bacterium]|nr:hypothetical protein [Candidatus Eremiobacteraeota bacterium]